MTPRPLRSSPPLHTLTLALLALAWLGVARVDAQEMPPGFDMGIFEITITDLPQLTAPAVVSPDLVVLAPLGVVLEQAGIPFERDSVGVHLRLVDEQWQPLAALVAVGSRRVQRGDSVMVAEPSEMVEAGGEVFLAPRVLGFLLATDVLVDFGALHIRIRPRIQFPAHRALEADRRRRLARIRMGWAIEELPDAPLRPLSGGGVLRYALSAGTPEPIENAVLGLEAGLALLGGQAVIGYTGSPGGAEIPGPDVTVRYERYVPENAWLTFVRAGDVTADASLARFIRGLTVTNRPLRRGQFFQDLALAPDLPPDWEIEVYQNGQLVAFTDPASPRGVSVPIGYGRTELDVRMIGPAGEVIRSALLYSIPETQLPAGRLEYSAGGGRCLLDDCDLLFVDADYGVTEWLTVGSGYQVERDSADVSHRPTLSGLLVRPGGWIAETRFIAGRLLTASTAYRGTGPVTGSFGFDLVSPEVGRVTLLPLTDTRWTVRGDIGRGGHRLAARLSGLAGESLDGWGASVTSGFRGGIGTLDVADFPGRPPQVTLSAFRALPYRWLDGRYTGNARVSMLGDRFHMVQVGLGGVWRQRLSVSSSIQWEELYGLSLNLSFSRQFPVGQVAGLVSAGGGSDFRSSLRTDGAIAVDPFRAVEPASYSGIGFGGVDLVAFHDLNGNGVRDSGEPVAPEVAIQAGDRTAVSDSTGHARVWGLVPYEKLGIRMGAASNDPRWAPLDSLRVIRPVPHVFNPVELPLVGTREVVAVVSGGAGIATTGGIGFTLTNLATGQVFRGMTLSDGTIYVSQVPVGTYRLEFSAASLEALRARVVGAPLTVHVAGDDPDAFVVDLPPILVEPLPEP